MNSPVIQLLLLAGIAIYLIVKLRRTLGTRDGFEKPRARRTDDQMATRRDFEVIDGGAEEDADEELEEIGPTDAALAEMKRVESDFTAQDFLAGARYAYEMIVTAFAKGDLDEIKPFLSKEVFLSFEKTVKAREEQGRIVETEFLGFRETKINSAYYSKDSSEAEISVQFVGEHRTCVVDSSGNVIEGNRESVSKRTDIWTFSRIFGTNDPNWQLVATGE
ncbi:MAG: Tim44/TimA family putative adaptor protein [Albidovulum sp.]|nr:Tim44/TimA family putative adaptor protein [Albidovulum sp.]